MGTQEEFVRSIEELQVAMARVLGFIRCAGTPYLRLIINRDSDREPIAALFLVQGVPDTSDFMATVDELIAEWDSRGEIARA